MNKPKEISWKNLEELEKSLENGVRVADWYVFLIVLRATASNVQQQQKNYISSTLLSSQFRSFSMFAALLASIFYV